jgi:hypothetical protein
MRVLMIGQHAGVFRALDPVMRELSRREHEIVFLHGPRQSEDRLPEITGVTTGERLEPEEEWPRRLRVGRQVINRGIYWRKSHPSPERVSTSLENRLPDDVRAKVRRPLWRSMIGTRVALRAWRWVEAASPASPAVMAQLTQIDPDVVMVSPVIWSTDPVEADYVHAARTLGLPTIGCANGWDDLTGHGTVHALPDLYLAWNESMAQEAVEIHDVPASAVRITGVPHLDTFFSLRPRATRADVCARMGRPDAPYVVFLGSPRAIWDDDSFVVKALADALARELGDGAPSVVVLPHASDSPASTQESFDQLAHATCVFGLNTPAFLEAVVADRPCVTIVSDTYWPAQGRTGHFRHLLKGRFLDVGRTMGDVAACVRRIMDGTDERAADRRAFTRWFLRPCGLEVAAGDVVASIIETSARPNAGRAPISAIARRHGVPGLSLASEGIGL